ncbi:NAD(P)H-quinone oxidoreductase [Mesorhizobium sp. CAU 1741]|uniref:NAD(P)H-quinone oxidoreductase n=1 Tax=Mesorhizobium sp. CAU 1741 TaxID=3140366 RepID=UPI00325C0569
MRAIIPARAGGPEVLTMVERDVPAPGAGQALIRVVAAGVNRHDCNQRKRGHGPAGSTDVLGLEVAGEIVAVGSGVDENQIGRRVAALVDGGGAADYVLADTPLVFDWPEQLEAIEAAALPEVMFTLQLNVVRLGTLKPGEWLLIHGGTSGIGMAGIPFARAMGARVVVTAGSAEKCKRAEEHGAERAINYKSEDFVSEVRTVTGGHGADVILDTVGGLYARRNVEALAIDGRLLHLSPAPPEFTVPLSEIMSRRARIMGSLLRGYPLERKAELADALRHGAWKRAAAEMRPVIDSVYTLEDIAKAHERMDEGVHIGKVVLKVSDA